MRRKRSKRRRRHTRSHRHTPVPAIEGSLYEPLPSQSSIRLITLHPGDFNDPIRCTLEVFELASVPPYEAISYVWGDPTPRNRLRCNGRRYLVGDNLYDAIRNVRLKDEPRVIWVDALCIDQANLGERSHQVLLMRDIYSRALRTLICLDIKPSVDSKELHWTVVAYEAILVIADWSERNRFERKWTGPKVFILLKSLSVAKFSVLRQALPLRLFSCKWFRRVWVIQEALLPPESIFIVDRQERRWETFGTACARIVEHWRNSAGSINPSSSTSLFQAYHIWQLLTRKRDGATLPLLVDRACFPYALATDPRDLIYSLLGVSKEQLLLEQQIESGSQGPVPLPDYKASMAEVFTDWTRYFIESQGNLEMLTLTSVIGRGSPLDLSFIPERLDGQPDEWTAKDASTPSWALRWHQLCLNNLYTDANSHVKPLGYRSSGSLALKLKPVLRRDAITPSGVKFDIVSWTGQVMYEGFDPEAQDYTMLHNFLSINAKLTSYPNGDTVQNVYAIVAAAGHHQRKCKGETSSPGEDMLAYLATASKRSPETTRMLDGIKDHAVLTAPYVDTVMHKCMYRRFFITEKGYLGLGPGHMEVGDQVTVLFGGNTPFILRKFEDHFKLTGESYIHGIMEGEVILLWEAGELEEQWFEIR
ncbi:Heterokaryon incompatibility protein (HET) domain containing protein [Hyaloscypha variabilis]